MRFVLFILIGFSLIISVVNPAAQAAEVLLGRIVSLDLPAGEIVLSPDLEKGEDAASGADTITVKFSKEEFSKSISGTLAVGDIVRVWGDFARENDIGYFQARQVSPGLAGGRRDPTGVRARLSNRKRTGSRSSSRGSQRGGGH